jgi:RNA polymerase sigma-70 factor (ECF subfamily)
MLDLFYYRDCSVSELSERIGIPQATVKSRLFYARKQLAQVLAGAGLAADSILPGVH